MKNQENDVVNTWVGFECNEIFTKRIQKETEKGLTAYGMKVRKCKRRKRKKKKKSKSETEAKGGKEQTKTNVTETMPNETIYNRPFHTI